MLYGSDMAVQIIIMYAAHLQEKKKLNNNNIHFISKHDTKSMAGKEKLLLLK